jgi:ferredoxin
MRLRVNSAVCDGFGQCNTVLPEVIRLDEWGFAFVEGDGEIPAGKEDAAREAVHICPVGAIVVAADD